MTDLLEQIRIQPGDPVGLADRGTRTTLGFDDKAAGTSRLEALKPLLFGLQRRLWAEGTRAVLLVLQGMDTSGKDGTIRRVLGHMNPQGVRVTGFGVPSTLERSHDYLWRIHAACPRRGTVGVFNRSHYEDVGVVRVHGWIDDDEAQRRFRQIRDFEAMLTENGTVVRKVWLHISREEQRERLQRRIDDPERNWKFNPSDLEARRQWDDYQRVYEEAIGATSTADCPWYVVPADRKWVRDVAVAEMLTDTLVAMDPSPPPPNPEIAGVVVA
jgi:PPK2 family polyphosphate:nucleotide phosphotransferase